MRKVTSLTMVSLVNLAPRPWHPRATSSPGGGSARRSEWSLPLVESNGPASPRISCGQAGGAAWRFGVQTSGPCPARARGMPSATAAVYPGFHQYELHVLPGRGNAHAAYGVLAATQVTGAASHRPHNLSGRARMGDAPSAAAKGAGRAHAVQTLETNIPGSSGRAAGATVPPLHLGGWAVDDAGPDDGPYSFRRRAPQAPRDQVDVQTERAARGGAAPTQRSSGDLLDDAIATSPVPLHARQGGGKPAADTGTKPTEGASARLPSGGGASQRPLALAERAALGPQSEAAAPQHARAAPPAQPSAWQARAAQAKMPQTSAFWFDADIPAPAASLRAAASPPRAAPRRRRGPADPRPAEQALGGLCPAEWPLEEAPRRCAARPRRTTLEPFSLRPGALAGRKLLAPRATGGAAAGLASAPRAGPPAPPPLVLSGHAAFLTPC
jgi:hypothetical protein